MFCVGPVKGPALTRLAFETLGTYEFAYKPKYLEPMKMLGYLDDENESIRRAAAHAFCQVMRRNARSQFPSRLKRGTSGPSYPGMIHKVWYHIRICLILLKNSKTFHLIKISTTSLYVCDWWYHLIFKLAFHSRSTECCLEYINQAHFHIYSLLHKAPQAVVLHALWIFPYCGCIKVDHKTFFIQRK